MDWQNGRQLAWYVPDGKSRVDFIYDGYGRRVRKTQGSLKTQYIYDANGKLLRQTDGSDTLTFIYDGTGLSGINHNGTDYIVRKSAQSDITQALP